MNIKLEALIEFFEYYRKLKMNIKLEALIGPYGPHIIFKQIFKNKVDIITLEISIKDE